MFWACGISTVIYGTMVSYSPARLPPVMQNVYCRFTNNTANHGSRDHRIACDGSPLEYSRSEPCGSRPPFESIHVQGGPEDELPNNRGGILS